jgi:hypothetical protein
VGAVDQLGPGANELVTMVAEQLEVPQGLRSARRRQALAAGDHPRECERITDVRLAQRRILLALDLEAARVKIRLGRAIQPHKVTRTAT